MTKVSDSAENFKCWHDSQGLVTVKPACKKPKGDKNKEEKTPDENKNSKKKCKKLEGEEKELCEAENPKPEKPSKKPKNPCKKLEGQEKEDCLAENPKEKPSKKPSSKCKGEYCYQISKFFKIYLKLHKNSNTMLKLTHLLE